MREPSGMKYLYIALLAAIFAIGCSPGSSSNKKDPNVRGVGEAAECATYWRVIEDWSACSKPCGGGESLLKMKCSSSEIIKITSRPCNMNACR